MAEYKLFPGCLMTNRLPFLEASAKVVFDELGLVTSPGEFSCCPNPVGLRFVDQKTWASLAARNISVAEKENKDIMSLCNGCAQSMIVADHELKHDAVLKKGVNEILAKVGKEYNGTINIKHFVRVLVEEVGLEAIKAKITHPLTGLKVACHPGCHYARPSHILKVEEDPMDLKYLHQLVEVTGATAVSFAEENLCCGNVVRNSDVNTANIMLKSKIDGAKRAEADCLTVNCPSCFQQFDSEQPKLKTLAAEGEVYKFPIFYITELLALAMGKDPKSLGLNFHRNKGKEALAKVNL
ncbi:CoB--CoM heterodisulfide reductase iron-sulfur subunit B family protein [Candidatus Lokiarchaeum ossiferum]|uniref:CoB--CoM heterodisulfide reductase iron-sulfur subunit B family protein n=1 Tax=Candidatus Lokiarchaeum ossiferum TaxID=2951803 RepID=UPI00352C5F0F